MINKILLLLFLTFCITTKSQSISIIKDSIFIDSNYFILEELKLDLKDEIIKNRIYTITQNTFDIFNLPNPISPKDRINIKKDTITNYILENKFKESNVGFEHFEIYFNKNNLLNISISIQSYGSPFESIQYYCFDLSNGDKIGKDLFLNQKKLLKKIKNKLDNENVVILLDDMDSFEILCDKNNRFTGINFILFDTENYRNSGYEKYIINFDAIEIKKFISSKYCKRLF